MWSGTRNVHITDSRCRWEAAEALRKHIGQCGVKFDGAPGGWREMYRVFKECKFVEDEGGVLFWKNGSGLAAARGRSS